ncbi:MAG: hypothetical protein IJC05_00470 [Phascolarctobacterium sp.]|nr:hypothetical protein [Phascolarctobacterium sp.]
MNNYHNEYDNGLSLQELWSVLVKNLPTIRNITIGAMVLATFYLFTATPVYESKALLRVKQPKGIANSILDNSGLSASGTKLVMNTYSGIIKSKSVLRPVLENTVMQNEKGVAASSETFAKKITVVPVKDTEIMEVYVRANSAIKAQRANELLVESFIERLTELVRAEHTQTKLFIEERLVEAEKNLIEAENRLSGYNQINGVISSENGKEMQFLVRDVNAAKEIYFMLSKRLEEAKVAELSVSSEVQVIDMPSLPEKRKSPNRTMTMVLAMIMGVLSGSTLVLFRELMNKTIKTSDDVERYLGLPVLGKIPSSESVNEVKNKENLNFYQKVWRAVWKK